MNTWNIICYWIALVIAYVGWFYRYKQCGKWYALYREIEKYYSVPSNCKAMAQQYSGKMIKATDIIKQLEEIQIQEGDIQVYGIKLSNPRGVEDTITFIYYLPLEDRLRQIENEGEKRLKEFEEMVQKSILNKGEK